jgi:hypothetical protein
MQSKLGSPELAPCRFIHCGDYDPVGLDEFLRLKTAVKDRAHLHVPPDLDRSVREHGRPGLLADSTAVLGRLRQAVFASEAPTPNTTRRLPFMLRVISSLTVVSVSSFTVFHRVNS